MKTRIAIAITTALMAHRWQPTEIAEPVRQSFCSYPLTNARHTGKAAERRAAKQRRRARV